MENVGICVHNRLMNLTPPRVMGILNLTSDSFYTHCETVCEEDVLSWAKRYCEEGADILDIGACSTRPGSESIDERTECERINMAVRAIRQVLPDVVISVDTFRSKVAQTAILAGADMINDVSGGQMDPEIWDVVAEAHTPYIFTHMRGTPATMQQHTDYTNLLSEVIDYFQRGLDALHRKGVADVIIDPGFGFAKTFSQNWELLDKLDYLQVLNVPVLVGVSRKSMIYNALSTDAAHALTGTTAAHMLCLERGANILRVHDVTEAKQTIQIYQQLKNK